jgi:uncharacterized protein YpiB (UPF0302 family)
MESMTRKGGRSGLVGRARAAAAIRDELREAREARAARKALERDLASYTTQADLNDIDAILDRHSDEETADIRRILAGRRRSA